MRRGDEHGFAGFLAAIVVLGCALRIAYALSQQQHLPLSGDSFVYSEGANALAAGRGWIDPYSFRPWPTASHPPLYILWLWIPSFVADGHHVSQLTHTLWSCIPGTASVLLCGLAGREIGGRRIGLVAAALAAVYPGMWVNDGLVLSETMAIFAVSGLVLLAYRYWNRPSTSRAIWLGAWCGLSALSRSELVLSFVLVLAPLVMLTPNRRWSERLGWLALAGAVGLAVLSPWLVFNAGRFHERVLLSSSSGRTMAGANCDATYSGPRLGFKSYECLGAATDRVYKPSFDESDLDQALRAQATDYIKDHIGEVPLVVVARWGRLLQLYQPRQEIRLNGYYPLRGRVGTELQFWSFYPVMVLAIVGAVLLRRRRVPVFPLLAIPAIALFAVALTFAEWRYRGPAEPALVLLAAVAIEAGLCRLGLFRSGRDSAA